MSGFFILSKLIWSLATPSTGLLALCLAGLLWQALRPHRRTGLRVAAIAFALLVLAAQPIAVNTLQEPLETRFARADLNEAPVTGVVVLGGGLDMRIGRRHGVVELNEAGDRLVAAAQLAKAFPEAKILISGADWGLVDAAGNRRNASRAFLEDLGVPAEQILIDDQSFNTHQNAVYSRALADPKPGERWLLVTSAWHMPRSMGCFRKAGFEIEPYAVDFRSPAAFSAAPGWTFGEGLAQMDRVAKEYVGLIAYWATGRTDALFPGPRPSPPEPPAV